MNTFINHNTNFELILSNKIPNFDNNQLIEENEIAYLKM